MRHFLKIFCFCLTCTPIFSQLGIGFRAGGYISRFHFSDPLVELAVRYRGSVQAAIPLSWQISNSFYLQADISYMQKGVRLFSKDEVDYSDYRINNHVLELPLLLKKNFSSWDSKLFLFGGPAIAYYVAGKVDHVYTEKQIGKRIKESVDFEGFRRWDLLIQLGGEFAWPVADELELFLDARYHFGFNNFNYLANGPFDEITTRGISLSFGARKLWEIR